MPRTSLASIRTLLALSLALTAACATEQTQDDPSGGTGEGGKGDRPSEPSSCAKDADMIAMARAELMANEPDFYRAEDFSDEAAFVERIADLNADGIDDVVVFPGMSYAGATAEQTIYLTDADGCATLFVGRFGAVSVTPAPDGAKTLGLRDLMIVTYDACESFTMRASFDGVQYNEPTECTPELCTTENNCTE